MYGSMGFHGDDSFPDPAYTYVIKNVYSDPLEVFDTIIKDERILERAESVTGAYDDFINQAQEWEAVIIGKRI